MKYDYLIVGAGLFGAIFAYEAKKAGKKVLVIDRRDHIGGNIYTKEVEGIQVHQYGAHIFHTSDKEVWDYIHIPDEDGDYVVYNENDGAWWEAHESEVMEMLKTLRIGTDA